MEDISTRIEALLKQQAAEGPATLGRYKTGLDAANDQDEGGIEKADALYSDKSNFEGSTLGALAKGLMSGGHGGRFGGGIMSGLSAAIDVQESNKKANLSREEKLIALDSLRANLTRNKAKDGLDVYNARGSMATGMQGTRNQLSDLKLGQEPLVGEEETPESSATSVLMDYNRNPQKYAGPEGQALVSNAQKMYQKMMQERAAAKRIADKAALKPRMTVETKRALLTSEQEQVDLGLAETNINRASELSDKANKGYFATGRGKVAENLPDWMVPDFMFGSPEGGKATRELNQVMGFESIKAVGNLLKGPTSDRDVRIMLDTFADPDASVEVKQQAVDRVMRQVQAQLKWNEKLQQGLRSGEFFQEGFGDDAGTASGAPETEAAPEFNVDDINILKDDPSPEAREDFDSHYGEGAAASILGDE